MSLNSTALLTSMQLVLNFAHIDKNVYPPQLHSSGSVESSKSWGFCPSLISNSYTVTRSNNQFCRNCNYYKFETVQHCGGTTTASPKTGLSCLIPSAYQARVQVENNAKKEG